jgi:hypothetical protein
VLTVATAMVNIRMDATWGEGVFLVLNLLGFTVIYAMGMLARLEDGRPRPYQSALLVSGLALLALTLYRLARVFSVDHPLSASGTVFWGALLLAAAAAWPAWTRNSAVCALIEALAGGAALLAFVDLVFNPRGPTTERWILLLLIIVYVLIALWRRDRERRHAVQMVNAAGIAVLVLQTTFFAGVFTLLGPAVGSPGFGWALIMLAGGFGLVAYAAVDREPGPGYLGVAVLALAVFLVGRPSPAGDLLFWPLFLLLVGLAGVGIGLRPRRRLPPEPGPSRTEPTTPLRPQPEPPSAPQQPEPERQRTQPTRRLWADDPDE